MPKPFKNKRSITLLPTEEEEQIAFIRWFRLKYPKILIFAIPNGGYRFAKTAARLKVAGVVAGIPDMFIPEWKLWVEMKRTKGGQISEKQIALMAALQISGYECIVARGCEDAMARIVNFKSLGNSI